MKQIFTIECWWSGLNRSGGGYMGGGGPGNGELSVMVSPLAARYSNYSRVMHVF